MQIFKYSKFFRQVEKEEADMKKGQIWIETVLYTLVGLAIIGTILAFVKPAIEEKRDSIALQQGVEILNEIDKNIEEIIYYGIGNSRAISINLRKGRLVIDSEEDAIKFEMESKHMFSQPNTPVSIGKIKVLTEQKAKKLFNVEMKILYKINEVNVTFNNQDTEKILQPSVALYRMIATNKGNHIDFSLA